MQASRFEFEWLSGGTPDEALKLARGTAQPHSACCEVEDKRNAGNVTRR